MQVWLDHHPHNGWRTDYQGPPPVDLMLAAAPDAVARAKLDALCPRGAIPERRQPTPIPNDPSAPGLISGAAPGAPVFEIRHVAGDAGDMLIRDRRLGAALAGVLRQDAVVLMRGHGSTVVGNGLRQAVFRAVYTEVNARLQSEALRLGEVTNLSDGEATATSTTNDAQIDRAWQLWRITPESQTAHLPRGADTELSA